MNKLIKWIVIIVLLLVAYEMFLANSNQVKVDLSDYIDMEVTQLESVLGLELPSNPSMVSQIHQYSNSTVTVNGNGNIGVIYFDGKQGGLYSNSRKYSFFGIELGDYQLSVENDMTFDYKQSFVIANDLMGGVSTTVFYEGSNNGDCLMVVYNNQSSYVAAVAYFDSYKKVTEKLSFY